MDQIIIQDLTVYAKHGVSAEENVLGQQFLVSVTMDIDLSDAGQTDNLSKSVDYGEACHFITDFMQQHTYRLIEAAAEHLAEELLMRYEQIKKLRVRVKKPWAPIGLPVKTVSVAVERTKHQVYLSLGSNMGDRQAYLGHAVRKLQEMPSCKVCEVSEWRETEPYGNTEQDAFLNGVLKIETVLSPQQLLKELHRIEKEEGRTRKEHWGPRTLDIDILFYDDKVIRTPDLVIPHRDLHNRHFVLEPMLELAPWHMHPVLNKTVQQLYEQLSSMEGKH